MLWRNTRDRFGFIHKSFHWVMAVIILLMLSVGFYMAALPFSAFKLQIYALHKSFGVLVLILLTGRILWRLFDRRPARVPTIKWWEDALAKLVHFALYFAIFTMCMTGLNMSAAGEFPVPFFGLFEVPPMIGKNEETFKFLLEMHGFWALVILGLLFLHFAGAFKHHLIDKDDTLKRMTTMKLGMKGGIALAVIAGILWIKPVLLYASDELSEGTDEIVQTQAQETKASDTRHDVAASTLPEWDVDEKESFIKFYVQQYGTPFEGHFENFDSEIHFDPNDLDNSTVSIEIDIGSLKTGSDDRDKQALELDWFDEKQFGEATFTADSFEHQDANQYIAHGTLTLRGTERPLDLPFRLDILVGEKKEAEMRAEITLNRLEYGVGQGQWQSTDTIGGPVKLSIYVKAEQKKPDESAGESVQ